MSKLKYISVEGERAVETASVLLQMEKLVGEYELSDEYIHNEPEAAEKIQKEQEQTLKILRGLREYYVTRLLSAGYKVKQNAR